MQHRDFWLEERKTFVTHARAASEAGAQSLVEDSSAQHAPAPSDQEPPADDDHDGDEDDERYSLEAIVSAVLISSEIANQDRFELVVKNALKYNGSAEEPQRRFPNRTTLDRWRAKMDRMLMLYRRAQWDRGYYQDCFFQLGADSSPQIGEDFFIVREEVLTVKRRPGWENTPLAVLTVESRTKPLTTLGWGESGLGKKHARMAHICILEAGETHQEAYRSKMRQGYADQ
eukprot:3953534-Pyramimonas_sp.AAC.1